MNKQDISVSELVKMVQQQQLQLPEIQRRYVWTAPRVRDLLDSLYRGYPSGSILVWQTDQPIPTRELAIEQGTSAFEGQKLLLDGQQRLTSLTAVMSGAVVKVRGRKYPIDILFNLDHPERVQEDLTEVDSDQPPLLADEDDADDATESEEPDDTETRALAGINKRTFVVSSKSLAGRPNWISVTKIFAGVTDAEVLRKAGVQSFDDPRYDRYTKRLSHLRGIRDYPYVMHVLGRDLSYEEVAEIFVRVNSLGVKLRSSDLALAQITARWRNFLDLVEAFQDECEKAWFTLDAGLLVRTMVVFATEQAKFNTVGSTSIPRLQTAWEEAKLGLRYAVNFLRSNCDIEDESLLSAPTLMIPVAVFSRRKSGHLTNTEQRELAYWLHVANARGRYSRGSSETLLNEDLQILFRNGTPTDLLNPIERLFGRLSVAPADLAGRPARSPLFPLSYLACRAQGAVDWRSGLGIQLASVGKQHVIEYHHIFPKKVLKDAKIDGPEVNEIANLAFITAATNKWIGKRSPADYFPEVLTLRGPEALEQQFIPANSNLWEVSQFKDFLSERRRMLADAINQHMLSARGVADATEA
jgi:hypothetical protein